MARGGQRTLDHAEECLRRGEHADALAAVERHLVARPRDAAGWLVKARALLFLGRHDDALAAADRTLDLTPGHAAALEARGLALLGLGADGAALEAFDAALRQAGESAVRWCGIAEALYRRREYADARLASDRALALDPRCAAAWTLKGCALAALAYDARALACFDEALRLNPADRLAARGRAQIVASPGRGVKWWLADGDVGLALLELAGMLLNHG